NLVCPDRQDCLSSTLRHHFDHLERVRQDRWTRPRAVGRASGGGPNFAVGMYTACVFSSSVIVRAPRAVGTVSMTSYLSGFTSCTTVTVPSAPFELNAFCLRSSNAAPSTPLPIFTDATTFPFRSSTTTIFWLSQTL